jgi:hypothetical protein
VKKQVIILLISLICTLALLTVTGCSEYVDSPTGESSKDTPSFEPFIISGEGESKSEPFKIPDRQWVVDWSYTSDTPDIAVFNVFIYLNRWIPYYVASIDQSSENTGSQVIHFGPGEYYIDICPHNIKSWKLVIKPA